MRRPSCLLALVLAAALFAAAPAAGALMAVDLGSEFLKISIVKPGRIPISIVNNEMSKRKSPAAVAFVNGDRLVGDEAASLAVRYPERVFTRVRDLLGRRHDDPAVLRLLADARLPFSVEQAPNRSTIAVRADDGQLYTAEELAASLLEYAKRLASAAADGAAVLDAVLVVPAFWGPAQRRALLDAADLAGLNVLSLVHTHAAAALQYGIERDFTNKSEHVVFVDVGAGAVEAALVHFSSFQPAGAPAGAAAISQFEVKDVAWIDHGVGCDALEAALLGHFAAAHSSGAEAVLSSPRAVAKLRKNLKRTKEVLSANSEAPVIVEELLAGEDFRGRITREEFEALVPGLWERVAAPVAEIFRRNNLTAESVTAVEMLGGCSRVPRVKAALSEALGGRSLDMHMDADEAVVLGAGLFAANLSTIFRLRKFGMADKAPYAVTFTLDEGDDGASPKGPDAEQADPQEERVLVPALRKIPTKRAIALHNLTSDSFSVKLSIDNAATAVLPCCQLKEALGEFTVEGIAAVVAKHGHSGKVALHTAVDQSGVFAVDRADAAVEIEEEVPPPPPPPAPQAANDTTAAGENETETAAPEGAAAEEKKEPAAEAAAEQPKKMRKRTVRVPLKVVGGLAEPGLSFEQRVASRKVLRMLRERDEAKRATAEARNDLEAYIIATRDRMASSDTLKAVSTEAQREEALSLLMDAEDWLYGDGDAALAKELKEKLKVVRKRPDEMEERAMEAASRPTAVKVATDFVELALKAANTWKENKPWISAEEAAEVVKKVEELQAWVAKGEEQQFKKEAHEAPAFKAADVFLRMDPARKAFTRLNTKPKPIEKKPEEPKVEANDTTIPEGKPAEGEAKSEVGEEKKNEGGEGAETSMRDEL